MKVNFSDYAKSIVPNEIKNFQDNGYSYSELMGIPKVNNYPYATYEPGSLTANDTTMKSLDNNTPSSMSAPGSTNKSAPKRVTDAEAAAKDAEYLRLKLEEAKHDEAIAAAEEAAAEEADALATLDYEEELRRLREVAEDDARKAREAAERLLKLVDRDTMKLIAPNGPTVEAANKLNPPPKPAGLGDNLAGTLNSTSVGLLDNRKPTSKLDQVTDWVKNNPGTTAGIGAAGAAGIYGLYKLYKYLKNKKNKTPQEVQLMNDAKLLIATKRANFAIINPLDIVLTAFHGMTTPDRRADAILNRYSTKEKLINKLTSLRSEVKSLSKLNKLDEYISDIKNCDSMIEVRSILKEMMKSRYGLMTLSMIFNPIHSLVIIWKAMTAGDVDRQLSRLT